MAIIGMEATRPDSTVSGFKRWMGTDKVIKPGRRAFRAAELSSLVLRSLMNDDQARYCLRRA